MFKFFLQIDMYMTCGKIFEKLTLVTEEVLKTSIVEVTRRSSWTNQPFCPLRGSMNIVLKLKPA